MPQLTSLVLKDGAATPANHTFAPRDITNGVATLIESTGVPIGDKKVSIALTRTQNGRQKVTMKLAVPTVQDQVISGISRPTAVRAAYCDVTFSFDQTSGTQERKDVLAYMASLFGQSFTQDVVGNLAAVY